MSLLFHLDKNNKAVLHPECVKLCPSLGTLSEQELLYVILYADYNSPYRQFPEHDRKQKAMFHAFDENEYDLIHSDRIVIAIEDYTSLQYSPKIEAAKEYQIKVDSLLEQLKLETSPTGIKKIDDAIDVCRKRIRMFEQEYEVDMQRQGVIKGKMELGYLENIQRNKKQYDSIKGKAVKL
mgnify:CR=1 FL=1|nr:hypothetical protein [uncultured Flavobacterium sp.]